MLKYTPTLPKGYREIARISFSDAPGGFLSDLKAVWPGVLLTALALLLPLSLGQAGLSFALFTAAIYPYFVLHELLHALVYKALTAQKIRIRFTKTGAWCALPEGYVSHSTSVLCTAAPLTVLGAPFAAWSLFALAITHWTALPAALLLTFHLLACRSDLFLLRQLKKYHFKDTLVQDNGTDQRIFQK